MPDTPRPGVYPEEDKHHWSGWPGAYCLKCFQEDPNEQALADGLWGFEEVEGSDNPLMVWTGTEEQKKRLEEQNICPVKGKLVWNDQTKKFDLHINKEPG